MRRAAILFLSFCPLAAPAKVDLVTLPAADRTELTIYNSQDLTLVRETRTLSFKPGENRIQFAWAGTRIDPTSLKLNTDRSPALTLEETIFPANTKDMAVWVVRASEGVSVPVDIGYFTAGLGWAASYQVRTNPDETAFRLQQFTKLTNASGQDFDNVHARAVVGEVHLIEAIAMLADSSVQVYFEQGALGGANRRNKSDTFWEYDPTSGTVSSGDLWRVTDDFKRKPMEKAREIVKKAVSEYTLFAIAGETDLKDGWSESMPNPAVAEVPFDLSYELDPTRYGNLPVKFYKLKNDTAHKLGTDPLPAGKWQVVREDGRGGIALEGVTEHKYVPKGEKVELNLGADGLVIVDEKKISSKREKFTFRKDGDVGGWDDVEELALEIRNSRSRPVTFKLTRNFLGDWSFDDVSEKKFERVDKQTVRWELTLPPASTTTLRCRLRTHRGDNAKSI